MKSQNYYIKVKIISANYEKKVKIIKSQNYKTKVKYEPNVDNKGGKKGQYREIK